MGLYNQTEKNIAREELISHSIQALTVGREENYLVTEKSFTDTLDYFYELLIKYLSFHNENFDFNEIINQSKEEWLALYRTRVDKKESSDLKVLYLSGPEPTNDLQVFLNHGVLPYNIWAIEGDKNCFNSAIEDLREKNHCIKIHKGSLKDFFKNVNETFDIVYFDACTPIISSNQNPLNSLKELFINLRLNHLSSLITNFAEPKSDIDYWSKILAAWFSVRYEECPKSTHSSSFSDIEARCGNVEQYSEFLLDKIDEYYDEFLTRFISVFASEIIPFWKVFSIESLNSKFFGDKDKLGNLLTSIRSREVKGNTINDIISNIPHYLLARGAYPLLNWADFIKDLLPKNHPLFRFIIEAHEGKTLYDSLYICTLLKAYEESYCLDGKTENTFKTFVREICSKELNSILENFNFFDKDIRLTCDTPMKNLLIELIIGLYGSQYISNAKAHLALKYKAKDTWMFSDVFIFDQCRYLYDFMPTLELIEKFMEDYKNQIIIRTCIDSIIRRHYDIDSNLFKWGFIESIGHKQFSYYTLNKRRNINDELESNVI